MSRVILSLLFLSTFFNGFSQAQPLLNVDLSEVSSDEQPATPSLESPIRPITFNIGLLEIEAEFIPAGGISPTRGYILKRSDVALLQTVVDRLPDDFSRECDARIGACIEEVTACQEDCNQRSAAVLEELAQTKDLLVAEREMHDSTRLKYTLYGFGGAIVSSLTTVLILKIAK